MNTPKSSTETLIKALRIIATETGDGVANATVDEAASHLEELSAKVEAAKSILWMAEQYADVGGSGGPEMRELKAAKKVIES